MKQSAQQISYPTNSVRVHVHTPIVSLSACQTVLPCIM